MTNQIEKLEPSITKAGSIRLNMDELFLPPIEEPEDPALKQVYAQLQAYFGKVFTPAKVHSARLPFSFLQFYNKVSELDRELTLSTELAMLVRQRVAGINVCLFCIDSNRAATIMRSMNQAKFASIDEYRTSPLFTEAERAAMDYATELTQDKKVSPETFTRMTQHFSEREICEIVWLVASEHVYDMTNIGLNIHSDMLCNIARKNKASA